MLLILLPIYKYKMRSWITLVEKYSEPNSFLLRHLRDDQFDYHQHWYEICQWAEETDNISEFGEDMSREDLEDSDPSIFNILPEELQSEAAEWVIDYLNTHDPANLPSNHFLSPESKLINRQTWLVHFSDHAHNIARNGFTHGVYDVDKLGLTTYFTHDSKKSGGYNFAFEAQSREAEWAAQKGKYGRHAVVFRNSGVKAWHGSDEENQIIFWGPDVASSDIVELNNDGGDWVVVSHDGREITRGEFPKIIKWIITNYDQYRKIL